MDIQVNGTTFHFPVTGKQADCSGPIFNHEFHSCSQFQEPNQQEEAGKGSFYG
jgi:hypothetical protein